MSLANAYNAKRKFAKGGRVYARHEHGDSPTGPTGYKNRNKSSDMDHGQKRGPQGYPKYQEQAQNQKGVHTPVSGVTAYPGGKGTSEAGGLSTETYAGKPHRELRDYGKQKHREKLAEMKAMPAPNIKGLAHGGEVKKAPNEDFVNMLIKERGHQSSDQMHEQADKYDQMANRASHPKSKLEHEKAANAFREAVKRRGYAEGGDVESEDMVDQIMRKHKMAFEPEHDEPAHPSEIESFDDEDPGEELNEHDMISKIMRKRNR